MSVLFDKSVMEAWRYLAGAIVAQAHKDVRKYEAYLEANKEYSRMLKENPGAQIKRPEHPNLNSSEYITAKYFLEHKYCELLTMFATGSFEAPNDGTYGTKIC